MRPNIQDMLGKLCHLAFQFDHHDAGHAAAVFKDQLWVVGGRGELYQTYNLRYQNRRGDVWSSPDGQTWMQSNELTGDLQLQNFDAVDPGALAPWYARFGHTLDVVQATNHSGVLTELMVLAGGYTPDPDNDVWVTEDGSESVGCIPTKKLLEPCTLKHRQ